MRRVILSARAFNDLARLEDWLRERSPAAADRLGPLLERALGSLAEFAERGRAPTKPGLRELPVPFGSGAYLIQYQVRADMVVVSRIKHSRERR